MKNAIKISVKNPCSENFINFRKTSAGGFCNSCQKEVIDFTSMSSIELLSFFSNTSEETGGRFKKSQLKTYEDMTPNTTSFVSKGIAVMSFSLLSLCAITTTHAQDVVSNAPSKQSEIALGEEPIVFGEIAVQKTYTVKGIVLDEENESLPGVNVVLKGSTEGAVTDFDGKFEFPKALEANDILVFSYIGYESKEYTIKHGSSDTIDVTINFDYADVELMGEIVVGGAYSSKKNIFQKFFALFK